MLTGLSSAIKTVNFLGSVKVGIFLGFFCKAQFARANFHGLLQIYKE